MSVESWGEEQTRRKTPDARRRNGGREGVGGRRERKWRRKRITDRRTKKRLSAREGREMEREKRMQTERCKGDRQTEDFWEEGVRKGKDVEEKKFRAVRKGTREQGEEKGRKVEKER